MVLKALICHGRLVYRSLCNTSSFSAATLEYVSQDDPTQITSAMGAGEQRIRVDTTLIRHSFTQAQHLPGIWILTPLRGTETVAWYGIVVDLGPVRTSGEGKEQ